MTKILRKIAIVTGAAAVSVGLMASVSAPADAAAHAGNHYADSSWGH